MAISSMRRRGHGGLGVQAGRWRVCRVGVVCGAVAALAALAACSPAHEPTQTGTVPAPSASSSTPMPTAEATATPTVVAAPTHPPEWQTGNNAGALAAATYFMELYNYVNATGDLTEWDAVSDPGCDFCANVHEDASAVYEAGGHLEGGTVTIADGTLVGFSDQFHIHAIQFEFAAAEIREFDASDNLVRTYDPESGFIIIEVGFTGSDWRLVTGGTHEDPAPPLDEASS